MKKIETVKSESFVKRQQINESIKQQNNQQSKKTISNWKKIVCNWNFGGKIDCMKKTDQQNDENQSQNNYIMRWNEFGVKKGIKSKWYCKVKKWWRWWNEMKENILFEVWWKIWDGRKDANQKKTLNYWTEVEGQKSERGDEKLKWEVKD